MKINNGSANKKKSGKETKKKKHLKDLSMTANEMKGKEIVWYKLYCISMDNFANS